MPSPRTVRKKRSRRLHGRNSVRKQLSYSDKKRRSPTKASYRVTSRRGQELLALLEKMRDDVPVM